MYNIVIFGKPGSGKGTQSEKLIAKYSYKHLSTGDLLRTEIAAKTSLGLAAKGYMDNGQLVPDEVVIGMISSALDNNPYVPGFLFDGFPRTVAQAAALDALLLQKHTQINTVLALQVPNDELIARLAKRGATSGRSDDTDLAIIASRLAEYESKTAPVANFYEVQKKVKVIDGIGSVQEIFAQIDAAINI